MTNTKTQREASKNRASSYRGITSITTKELYPKKVFAQCMVGGQGNDPLGKLSLNQTINAGIYCQQLDRLRAE